MAEDREWEMPKVQAGEPKMQEGRPRMIEDVRREAGYFLQRSIDSEEVKNQDISSAGHPVKKAAEIYQFALRLMDNPDVREFFTRRHKWIILARDNKRFFKGEKARAIIVSPLPSVREGSYGKARYYQEGCVPVGTFYIGEDMRPDEVLPMLTKEWDTGNTTIVNKLAQLTNIAVVKKFQKVIK